jgi:hypothetical protein
MSPAKTKKSIVPTNGRKFRSETEGTGFAPGVRLIALPDFDMHVAEQLLRPLQIGRVEAFGEQVVDWREEIEAGHATAFRPGVTPLIHNDPRTGRTVQQPLEVKVAS